MNEFCNVWSSVTASPVPANSKPQKFQTSQEHSQQKCKQNFFKHALKWNCLKILLSGWIYPECTFKLMETVQKTYYYNICTIQNKVSTTVLFNYSSNTHVVTHSKSIKSCITFQPIHQASSTHTHFDLRVLILLPIFV